MIQNPYNRLPTVIDSTGQIKQENLNDSPALSSLARLRALADEPSPPDLEDRIQKQHAGTQRAGQLLCQGLSRPRRAGTQGAGEAAGTTEAEGFERASSDDRG